MKEKSQIDEAKKQIETNLLFILAKYTCYVCILSTDYSI